MLDIIVSDMTNYDMADARTLAQVRMVLKDALAPKYGEGEAAAMARKVLMHLKGWDLPHLLADENREASDYVRGRAGEILDALLRDVPLQYALGETSFYGLSLKVAPGVLIPRPETEELVDMIVKENQKPDLRVLDLCTGSGAIALALARNLPYSEVTAVDVSPEAVKIARENAEKLKAKVEIICDDVFRWMPQGEFNIMVANPPYVDESEKVGMDANVLNYEPHIALFVPDDNPLLFYRRIAAMGEEALAAGGRLYFEINPRHAGELKAMLESLDYVDVRLMKDVHGKVRFATATHV